MTELNSSRPILSEIVDRTERPRIAATPTRMIATEPTPTNILNNAFVADPLGYLIPSIPSPDELIIRQRGRRRRVNLNWSPDKCPVPSRCPFQKTPTKVSSSMTLRSSPRRKLLDGLHFQTTPEKASKPSPGKVSSAPSLRARTLSTPVLKRLVLDDSNSTPQMKRTRMDEAALKASEVELDPNYKLKGRLNLLSHKQLVNMVLNMVKEDSQVESLIRSVTPRPDLSDSVDNLQKILRHIHRCFPKASHRYSAPSSNSRVSSHIKEFKETMQSQCTRLYKANEWDLLLDYHQMVWPIVRSLPTWDNSKHEYIRMQCFKLLCSMASIGLKHCAAKIGVTRVEAFEKLLHVQALDSQDVLPVIAEIKEILAKQV